MTVSILKCSEFIPTHIEEVWTTSVSFTTTFWLMYLNRRHMMTHTDEKPHVCEECDSAYKTLDALQRHQR